MSIAVQSPLQMRAIALRSRSTLLIFLLAFSVRLGMLIAVGIPNILERTEVQNIAISLATTNHFANPYGIPTGATAHCNPAYPFLLSIIFRLCGYGFLGNLVRVLLLILTYSLLYALFPVLAEKFGFPRRAGLIAGYAAALLPVKRSAEVFRGWEDPYAALALAFLLIWTLKHWNLSRRTVGQGLYIGALWGAAFYISVSLLPIFLGLLVLDVARDRGFPAIRKTLITGLAAFALMVPWIIRNRIELGAWVFMRSNLGLELRYSNHSSSGVSAEALNADPAAARYHPFRSRAEALQVKKLGEVEYNRRAMTEARAWIAGHKLQFVYLCIMRLLYFWLGPFGHPYEVVVTSLYTVLGFLGLPLIRRHVGIPQSLIWCNALLAFPVIYYLVQYINRYRVPIDWMIWLSMGLFATVMLERGRAAQAQPCEIPRDSR